MQNLAVVVVAEIDVFEFNFPLRDVQIHGIGRIQDIGRTVQQVEHFIHINQRLFQLAVHHAEEVKRHVQLQHQGVDQHQITQGQSPRHHTLCGVPEDDNQRDGDDHLLAKIKQRQGVLRLNRGVAELLEALVIAIGLELLVVEIFNSFKIEQRINRFLIGF